MAIRISFQPKCLNAFSISNLQIFSYRSFPKPSLNPSFPVSEISTTLKLSHPRKSYPSFHGRRRRRFPGEVHFQLYHLGMPGRCSTYCSASVDGGGGEALPWLGDAVVKESKGARKNVSARAGRSSWEESAEKLLQKNRSSMADSDSRGETVEKKRGAWYKDFGKEGEVEGGEAEAAINDPRWDRIKTRVGKLGYAKRGSEKPEMRRFSRQENWGRKTFKEASESSVPRMVGEGVYGVGPVLAALSAGRREFYVLYVQEGMDFSSNNRKKKDKKGFEKVLRMADRIGLSVKEVSKHDLNMVVDSRPHQGLVLDASPLEMVNVKELEEISEDDKGLLWVALDEVTDPQNLGAIIRSSYFFGAAGVILCAKNSAPLSGVVSKASAGSLELMELRSCKNMMQFLTSSAENGWRVLGGSVSSRAVALDEVSAGAPTILVLGSEGTGLRPLVERSCTQLVRIPGNIAVDASVKGFDGEEEGEANRVDSGDEFRSFLAVESLNVSVAAGVLLNHLIGSNFRVQNHGSPKEEGQNLGDEALQ